MKKIENKNDLRSERARLKLELSVAEDALREDVEWIKSELRPVHLAGKLLNQALINKDRGLVNEGVSNLIDTVLKSTVLSKSGYLTRWLVPFILKNLSSNYLLEKKPEIFGMLKRLISKARKSNHDHYHKNGKSHYDQSTVDEMNY